MTEKDIQERFSELPGIVHELCTNPRMSAYFKKAPCLPRLATPQQLKDDKTITADEMIATNLALQSLSEINAETRRLMIKSGLEPYVQQAKHADEDFDPRVRENQQALLNSTITWGEYNRRRLELQNEANQTP